MGKSNNIKKTTDRLIVLGTMAKNVNYQNYTAGIKKGEEGLALVIYKESKPLLIPDILKLFSINDELRAL